MDARWSASLFCRILSTHANTCLGNAASSVSAPHKKHRSSLDVSPLCRLILANLCSMDAKDSLEPFSEPPFVVHVWFSVPLDLGFGAMSSVRARTARRPSSFAIGSSSPAPPGLFLLADFLASVASTHPSCRHGRRHSSSLGSTFLGSRKGVSISRKIYNFWSNDEISPETCVLTSHLRAHKGRAIGRFGALGVAMAV